MALTPYLLALQQMKIKGKAEHKLVDFSKPENQFKEDEACKSTEPKKSAPKAKTASLVKSPVKKRIKKVSKKRAKQERAYKPIRKKFLQDHPICEAGLEDCLGVSSEIHHQQGREGERLLKVIDFKALCSNCHRKITDQSRQAIADGHSKSRLGKPQK